MEANGEHYMRINHRVVVCILVACLSSVAAAADPDWGSLTQETARNLSTLIKVNTTNPPGNEGAAAEVLRGLLEKEGIPGEVIPTLPGRAAFVGRLKGTGAKRPLICMGHLDVVPVELDKWTIDPFGGEIRDGFVWGRGSLDDKGMALSCAMAAITLKRQGIMLDRDLIILAEGDEEGTVKAGIKFLIQNDWNKIDAEYALNEGGGIKVDSDGKVRWVGVGTSGKVTHNIEVLARGTAGHSSQPVKDNAIVHLAAAIAKIGTYDRPVRLTPTTTGFFEALSAFSPPEQADAMRRLVAAGRAMSAGESGARADFDAAAHVLMQDNTYNMMLHDVVTPTIIQGGTRHNVIPNEAKAILSVRALPSTTMDELYADLTRLVNDSQVSFSEPEEPTRPAGADASLDTPMYSAIEKVTSRMFPGSHVVPEMAVGGTDSMPLLAKGVLAYGLMPFPLPDGERRGVHGNDERIKIDALGKGVELLYRVILEVSTTK
jgi:acetylornithine deacetylase/succinyl-diaminopimelate desuccinylase-like protein